MGKTALRTSRWVHACVVRLVAVFALVLAAVGVGAAVTPAYAAEPAPSGALFSWGAPYADNLGRPAGDVEPTPRPVCPVGANPAGPCADALAGATAVSVSATVGAAVVDGGVVTWGANGRGQLGDGSNVDRRTPGRVCAVGASVPCTQFLTGAVDVATLDETVYALLADGTVAAWGDNTDGRLGAGTGDALRSVPTRVCAVGQGGPCSQFLSGVASLAPGGFTGGQMLAVDGTGRAYAWGDNDLGQLGDGTTADRSVPVRVCAPGQSAPCAAFLDNAVSVDTGATHSIAATTTGAVYTWGYGAAGLGSGAFGPALTPTAVCAVGAVVPCGGAAQLTGIRKVFGQANTFAALDAAGKLVMWGDNFGGKLGDGTSLSRAVPTAVCALGQSAPCGVSLTGVADVAIGLGHVLATSTSGELYSWGIDHQGQLGSGAAGPDRRVPGRVCAPGLSAPCGTFMTQVIDIAAAASSFAIRRAAATDVSVTLSAAAQGLVISNVTYTATVTNAGPDAVTAGTVTFTYPAGLVSPVATGCTINTSTRTAVCPIGTLAPGSSVVKTLRVSVGLLTIGGQLTGTAALQGIVPVDVNAADNNAAATCQALTSLLVSC